MVYTFDHFVKLARIVKYLDKKPVNLSIFELKKVSGVDDHQEILTLLISAIEAKGVNDKTKKQARDLLDLAEPGLFDLLVDNNMLNSRNIACFVN